MNKAVATVRDSAGTKTVYIPCECSANEHLLVWKAYRPAIVAGSHVDIDNYFTTVYTPSTFWYKVKMIWKYLFAGHDFEARSTCTSLSLISLKELHKEIGEYLKEAEIIQHMHNDNK